ncbi:MAG TPA: hypothetical protein VH008_33305, partial [Pseudonocardia sp.]|nr:hypothetical protein [Pseudonocardia sp.]
MLVNAPPVASRPAVLTGKCDPNQTSFGTRFPHLGTCSGRRGDVAMSVHVIAILVLVAVFVIATVRPINLGAL